VVDVPLDGKQDLSSPFVLVLFERQTRAPAVARQLTIGCLEEPGALLVVLADEDP
jgi:hypothetical protein